MKKYAPLVTRLALSFVFLWFGLNQIFDPSTFMGYLPDLILSSDYAHTAVVANGIFETLFGTLLLLGLFTRIAALVLSLHLLGIIFTLGYNDIAIRDIGLMLITFSISLGGADQWSLDYQLQQR